MKKCIINFASKGNKVYEQGQRRLVKSLRDFGFSGDIITWQKESEFGCPPHSQVPYAFKPYAFQWAIKNKYDLILWMDAPMHAVRPFENDVFCEIEKNGWLLQRDGNRLGHWTHDRCLEKYGITRDEAMDIQMFAAMFMGFNIHNEKSREFLEKWYEASQDGFSFQGRWKNHQRTESKDPRCQGHRHDMSVGTILAHQIGMPQHPAWKYFTYGRRAKHPNVYFTTKGIK